MSIYHPDSRSRMSRSELEVAFARNMGVRSDVSARKAALKIWPCLKVQLGDEVSTKKHIKYTR